MAGDEETGVTIIELVEELDAGPIAAQERFCGRDRRRRPEPSSRARPAELTPDLIDAALDNQRPAPQTEDGATYAEKIGPADREARLVAARRRSCTTGFALFSPAHRGGARAGRGKAGDRLALASSSTAGWSCSRCSRRGRRRMTYDEFFLRGPATDGLARTARAAYENRVPRLRAGRVCRPGRCEPRSRVSTSATARFAPAARLRDDPARRRTLDYAIEQLGRRPMRKLGPRRFGPRCDSAPTSSASCRRPRHAAVNEGRRACAARQVWSERSLSRTPSFAASRTGLKRCSSRCRKARSSTPTRTGSSRCGGARTFGREAGARADAGAETMRRKRSSG